MRNPQTFSNIIRLTPTIPLCHKKKKKNHNSNNKGIGQVCGGSRNPTEVETARKPKLEYHPIRSSGSIHLLPPSFSTSMDGIQSPPPFKCFPTLHHHHFPTQYILQYCNIFIVCNKKI